MLKSDPIPFPTYERNVIVVIGKSLTEVNKAFGLPWEETDDFNFAGYSQIFNGDVYIHLLDEGSRLTILHECIHAINLIYTEINAQVDTENDEVYVRDVSWLQDQVLTLIEKYTNDLELAKVTT